MFSSKGFYWLLSAFVLTLFIIRGLLYPAAPTDDAEQLLFSQVFRWGYDGVNPPLYTWLLIAIQKIFGTENWTASMVKFFFYWLIFLFLYVLGRRAIEDEFLAILAALSPLWLYYVAWDAVLSYSHSVLATSLVLAALIVLLGLQDKNGLLSYVLFGFVVGLGVLSKYTFVLAAFAMLFAGLIYRPFRRHVLHPNMFIALIVSGLVITPHVLWLLDQSDLIGSAVSSKFEIRPADSSFLGRRLKGVTSTFTSLIGFVSPLWLILLLVFWRPLCNRLKIRNDISPTGMILAIYIITIITLIGVLVLVSGSTKIRAHYMLVLIPLPVVFFAWLKPALGTCRRPQVYAVTLLSMVILLVGSMGAKYVSEPMRCKRCQLLVPYKEIGQKIRDAGFNNGTIFAYYFPHDLAGNLRSVFPNTRIISTKFPAISRPLSKNPGQCLIIWMPPPSGVMDDEGMIRMANKFLETNIQFNDFTPKSLNFIYHRTRDRTDTLHYILIDPGQGMCR